MRIFFMMMNLSDLGNPSGMYSDLISEFIEKGHEVIPVAVGPGIKKSAISTENGIGVLRIKTLPLFNVNPISKGIANVLLPFQYKNGIRKFLKSVRPELIIMPTPPVTLSGVVKYLKRKYKVKFYLILRDIFPANAADLGMMKKGGLIYRYFRNKEKELYRLADSIGCMSNGNIKYISSHNPDVVKHKLHVLMNFQKPTFQDYDNNSDFRVKYRLEKKYLVAFGGNMGVPQKMENVIALANRCMQFREVVFLLVGEGTQRTRIEKLALESGVTNIKFLEPVSRSKYLYFLRECQVGLISLNEKFSIPNFPSKTLSYFDAGIPVLASVDKATDFGDILNEAGAGLVSFAGDTDAFYENFCKLYYSAELRKEMGQKGRIYFLENMTVERAYHTIMEHV
jgi:glycosyltransferase involved in cell wall biosynthesis